MSTVVSLICLGPSIQQMTHHFLLHGSLRPTNLEKNLKPCCLLFQNGSSEEEIQYCFENTYPSIYIYIMEHPDFIKCSFKENSIGQNIVKMEDFITQ